MSESEKHNKGKRHGNLVTFVCTVLAVIEIDILNVNAVISVLGLGALVSGNCCIFSSRNDHSGVLRGCHPQRKLQWCFLPVDLFRDVHIGVAGICHGCKASLWGC